MTKKKKYYWMFYSHNNIPRTYRIYNETVTGNHPFEIMARFPQSVQMNMVLENWKEISKEEYDLKIKLNKKSPL